jgi:DnaJ-class molecular chaperone
MTFAEKPRPVAYCAGCNLPSLSAEVVGTDCHNAGCSGSFRSARASDDWTMCAACDGSGRVGAAFCRICHGSGWMPVKHKLAK